MRLVGIIRRARVAYIVGDCDEGRLGLGRCDRWVWIDRKLFRNANWKWFFFQGVWRNGTTTLPIARLLLPFAQPACITSTSSHREATGYGGGKRPVLQVPKPIGTKINDSQWSETGGSSSWQRPEAETSANRSIPSSSNFWGERELPDFRPRERQSIELPHHHHLSAIEHPRPLQPLRSVQKPPKCPTTSAKPSPSSSSLVSSPDRAAAKTLTIARMPSLLTRSAAGKNLLPSTPPHPTGQPYVTVTLRLHAHL